MDLRVEVYTEEAQAAVGLGREVMGGWTGEKARMSGGSLPVRAWSRRLRGRDLTGQQECQPSPSIGVTWNFSNTDIQAPFQSDFNYVAWAL